MGCRERHPLRSRPHAGNGILCGAVLFRSGANATLTGDMLTTVGNNTVIARLNGKKEQ